MGKLLSCYRSWLSRGLVIEWQQLSSAEDAAYKGFQQCIETVTDEGVILAPLRGLAVFMTYPISHSFPRHFIYHYICLARERAELLGRIKGESSHVLTIFDEEAQAMQSARNSSRMLEESYATGVAILSQYAGQRNRLKKSKTTEHNASSSSFPAVDTPTVNSPTDNYAATAEQTSESHNDNK